MKIQHCLSDQELGEFDSGALPAARFEDVSEHLESCRECATRYERLEASPDQMLEHLRLELPQEALADDSELELLVSRAVALQQTEANAAEKTRDDRASQRRTRIAEWIPRLLTPAAGPDELGRLGCYRVLRVLGMGGMGLVFEAEDLTLKRLVALKVMNPESSSARARDRFLREAQAMAAVHHDHVVTVYQVGEDRGVAFLAMDLLQGQSLADRLREVKKFSVGEALRIIRQVAQGLEAAHAIGLTHRDVKPDNIWLERNRLAPRDAGRSADHVREQGVREQGVRKQGGINEARAAGFHDKSLASARQDYRVKILDFGLARAADEEQNLTQSGVIVGTPNYLSPEQAQGVPVDARTDLFSLGVVLYEMLSGEKPFARNTLMATLRSITSDTSSELDATVPADVAALVKRLLQKRPEDRFASCTEAIAAIECCERQLLEDSNSTPLSRPASELAPRTATVRSNTTWSRKWLALCMAAMTLMLGVIITVRDKKGNIVARLFAPEGSTVNVEANDGDRGAKEQSAKAAANTTAQPVVKRDVADHLPAMSPVALVQRPPKLTAENGEAVQSWTVLPVAVPERSASALSFDGRQMATFGKDGSVRVWDVEGKSLRKVLIGHASGPCSPAGKPIDRTNWGYVQTNSRRFGPIAWRPPGDPETLWLATASRDGSVRVWDVETGTTVWKDARDGDLINMLAWSPDGTKLAVGYDDGKLRTWEADSGKELKSLSLAEGPPFSLGWSPNSNLLAVHSSAGVQSPHAVIIVWDFNSGKSQRLDSSGIQISKGPNHLHGISAMRWSPDGKQLAVKEKDGLSIYETTDWKATSRLTSGLKDNPAVQDLDWSPDGTSLLVSWNGQLQMHDLKADKVMPVPLKDNRWALKVEWTPRSTRVALWNVDVNYSYSAILDTQTMGIRSLQDGDAMVHEFSSDGTRLLAGNGFMPGVFVSDADKASFWQPPAQPRPRDSLSQMVWAPNGAMANFLELIWSSGGNQLHAWKVQHGRFVSWSPDSQKGVVYNGLDNEYELLSIKERRREAKLEFQGIPKPHSQMVWAIAYSPDGSQIACGGQIPFKGELFIVDGSNGKMIRRLKLADGSENPHWTRAICWSRQGDRIAVVRDSNRGGDAQRYRLLVIDSKDGKILWPQTHWPQNAHMFNSLIWSPGDRWLLCSTPDCVEVYDGKDGKYQTSFAIPANSRAIHFLDQVKALCGTRDGFVYRLDFATGKHEIITKGLGSIIEISPDGQQLAVDHGGLSIHSSDGRMQSSFLSLGNYDPYIVSAEGHFWSNDQALGPFWATKGSIPQSLVYIVQTASGQQTLTPIEFANRFKWQNDPNLVRLK